MLSWSHSNSAVLPTQVSQSVRVRPLGPLSASSDGRELMEDLTFPDALTSIRNFELKFSDIDLVVSGEA